MVTFTNNRNTTTANGDHYLACIYQSFNRFFFNDINRFWRGNNTAIAATSIFFQSVTLFCQLLGFLLGKERTDRLGRVEECRIVSVDFDLGNQRCYRFINATRKQFFS